MDRESRSSGTSQGFWDWLPNHQSKTVTVSKEDRNRIEGRELLKLSENQAIVFDTETNRIARI